MSAPRKRRPVVDGAPVVHPCGCRHYQTKIRGVEQWTWDYCLRDLGLSSELAQLAMMFFCAGIAYRRMPSA